MKLLNKLTKAFRVTVISLLLSVVVLMYGCEQTDNVAEQQPQTDNVAEQQPQTAQAIITSTSEPSQAMGEVNFSQTPEGLQMTAMINNAPPGEHGFHIHESGSCADAGQAAGGHFNPDGVKHGLLVKDGFANAHAGDLGNISVSPDLTATKAETLPGLTFEEGKYAVANRAMIIHENPDDFGQPTGNAGGRIGCGVIQITGS